jgi:hypothetical protein
VLQDGLILEYFNSYALKLNEGGSAYLQPVQLVAPSHGQNVNDKNRKSPTGHWDGVRHNQQGRREQYGTKNGR